MRTFLPQRFCSHRPLIALLEAHAARFDRCGTPLLGFVLSALTVQAWPCCGWSPRALVAYHRDTVVPAGVERTDRNNSSVQSSAA